MTDPRIPDDSMPLSQPGGDARQAEHTVKEVLRWYQARLAKAGDLGLTREAIDELQDARDQAADDLDLLEEADEDTTVQIAVSYAAKLKELTGT
ncbi:hypothetical protein [Streptomyces sp. NPDC089919]|uniref:hypothetical protein n=1 Tax=Streptomyces sp. NPDC089919 TaxID=3155188 RepID=UPI003441F936